MFRLCVHEENKKHKIKWQHVFFVNLFKLIPLIYKSNNYWSNHTIPISYPSKQLKQHENLQAHLYDVLYLETTIHFSFLS